MGKMNRMAKRKMQKAVFRAKIALEEVHAQIAMQAATDKAANVVEVMQYAFALCLALGFSKLQKKDSRMEALVQGVDKFANKIVANELTPEEKEICKKFDDALAQWLRNERRYNRYRDNEVKGNA